MPVATAPRTIVEPATIPTRYGTERRSPCADPDATRLIVAGPGLPMIASDVSTSDPTDPKRTDAASGSPAGIPSSMPETLRGVDADRLERSCTGRPDRICFGSGAEGI